jgi:hypothetical protein
MAEFRDLREWLNKVDDIGELKVISEEVDGDQKNAPVNKNMVMGEDVDLGVFSKKDAFPEIYLQESGNRWKELGFDLPPPELNAFEPEES